MRNQLLHFIVFTAVSLSFVGCYSKKNLNYFSQDKRDSSHNQILQDYEAKIQPGDKLSIFVTALNPTSALPYNLSTGTGTAVLAQNQGISVDSKGYILYPQLGFIKAGGLTKNELRDTLLRRVSLYLTEPVVTVDFLNFKVTVLGEVNKQGPINVTDGKLTLLEALGQAGDIALTGRRDSIIIIRETSGKREFGYINLLSNDIFKSPYFVLQQNDVVYVQMNKIKQGTVSDQITQRNISIAVSITAALSTLGLLIYNITR
jgi:polysaccharide export outer membrane protein